MKMTTKNKKFSVDNLTCMIDLHLHLDGAISVESARELIKMQKLDIPQDEKTLRKLLQVSHNCKSLDEFLEKFSLPCTLTNVKKAVAFAIQRLISELKEQGLMYAEIRFAPQKHTMFDTQDEVVKTALEASCNADIPVNLILCCMRDKDNREKNFETVDVAKKYLGKGICAIDLAGAEALYPLKDYEELFAYARKQNVPFVIHAGEVTSAENVDRAIDYGAIRIGHGIRAVDDIKVVDRLVNKNIPLELCPTSNICTSSIKDIKDFPIMFFLEKNVKVTINTDDPAILGTNIKNEYSILCKEFDLGKDDVKKLLINAVDTSFANIVLKQKMKTQIESEFSKC